MQYTNLKTDEEFNAVMNYMLELSKLKLEYGFLSEEYNKLPEEVRSYNFVKGIRTPNQDYTFIVSLLGGVFSVEQIK